MHGARRLFLLFVLFAGSALTQAAPTVQDFLKRAEISSLSISPSGSHVAYLTPAADDDCDLNVFNYITRQPQKFRMKGEMIWGLYWLDDQRMVLRGWRDAVFDLSKGKITYNISSAHGTDYYRVFSEIKDRPLHFYVLYFYGRDQPEIGIIDARRSPANRPGSNDSRYNQISSLAIPSGETRNAFTDQRGEIRVIEFYRNGKLRYHFRRPDNTWSELPLDPERVDIKAFSADPAVFYVAQKEAQTGAGSLHLYNAIKQEMGAALFADAEYSLDGSSLFLSADGAELHGLTYFRDKPVQVALSPIFKEVQTRANNAFDEGVNLITGYDDKLLHFSILNVTAREQRALVFERGPRGFSELAALYPQLPSSAMCPVKVVHYTSRDGLNLEGYLTMPEVGYGDPKPPLLILPHDGPWDRDIWWFNRRVQFFANRGYAVFQPNYRGSTGYLKPVSLDGKFAFRKMHEDVTDGVRHVIATGSVDASRVGILGSGFGGFLAMSGATFEPNLYRCAATYAGIFDWKKLILQRKGETVYGRFDYDQLIQHLGDPQKDQALFDDISPINHLQNIKVPVFVAHRKYLNDEVSQSRQLLDRLHELRTPVEILALSQDVESWIDLKNDAKYYTAVEAFLEKHLKGTAAPAAGN